MSMHIGGWYESLDPAGVFVTLEALLDERMWVEGDNIRVPQLNYLIGAGAYATTAATVQADAYIYSPTLNILGEQHIAPLSEEASGNNTGAVNVKWADYMGSPLDLGYDETMRAFMSANPAAAGHQAVFILMSDLNMGSVPAGRRLTLQGTYAAPTGTGQWNQVNPTWLSEMPPGDYGVIGMQHFGSSTLAARLNFRTGQQWRPGVLGQRNKSTVPADYQKPGMMGIWGEFTYTQPPTLDVVQTAAQAGTVLIDVVQLRSTR